ncbi:threonine aldolase [Marchantia polymorpha subsp. ruderalis]
MTKQMVEEPAVTNEENGKMEHGVLLAKSESSVEDACANGPNGVLEKSSDTSRIVDLRSDTVTKPTALMRIAMAEALVDDDILAADPTAAKLQERMANVFGKEAGLFVPSGTMGNLIAVLVHCEVRGCEVIIGSESHIHVYEQGGISTLGGVYPHVVPNEVDGTMDLRKVEAAIRPNDEHFPISRLICIENTHNRCGGRCLSAEYTDQIGDLAKSYGLKFHIDGARIFNASAALGVSVDRLCKAADSVSICLSKGLAAPVGSVLVGSYEFIAKARRLRKALGGGMRQIGVLCAPGLISLNHMVQRLDCDHRNARLLAEGLESIRGLRVDVDSVETNIVFIEVTSESPLGAKEICEALKQQGILVMHMDRTTRIRLVTHYHITEDDARLALSAFQETMLKASSKVAITNGFT